MSEEQVVRNCAPTLAGLKTGNLFACPYENRDRNTLYPGGTAGLSAEPEPAAWEKGRPGSPPAYPSGQGADLPLPASAAGKRPLLRILRSASQRVRLQLPGRQPMPDKACPEIKAAGGFPPRDRPVFGLSPGGCGGFSSGRRPPLQAVRPLEGI